MRRHLLVLVTALCLGLPALAQDSYKIQVYDSGADEPGAARFGTHTNFTVCEEEIVPGAAYQVPSHHERARVPGTRKGTT